MNLNIVGQPVQRIDAVAKVTGQAKYTGDFFISGMLVGKVLRSPHAHAIIKSMDTVKAKALPGVEAVLTASDVAWPFLCHRRPSHGPAAENRR